MEHLYIHIPFCKNICSYCDFCKMLYNQEYISKYLIALEQEINEYYMNEEVLSIYIGGGTPSSLNITDLTKLFEIIKIINKHSKCEFTFECNPEDLNEALVDFLVENQVNRLSIGVQSFNKANLLLMERQSDYNDLKKKIDLIKSKGINNINLDLIYAVPDETIDVVKHDLKLILKLNPEHISTYSLIIENNTILKIKKYQNISEDLDAKMYEYIVNKLIKKGYNHYEVSNFAKKDNQSNHNLSYWNNQEYYGFGLGASGYISGFRYENTKNINEYFMGHFRSKEALLSKQEIMEYEIILGLRKMGGINVKEFYKKYQINIQDAFPILPLLKSKELIYKNDFIFLNPNNIYIMNEILLKLI